MSNSINIPHFLVETWQKIGLYSLILVLTATVVRGQNINITQPSVSGPTGTSVNSFSGNLYHNRYDYELEALGDLNIDIAFSYNTSRRNIDEGYGYGWTFTFGMSYQIDSTNFHLTLGDGRTEVFAINGNQFLPMIGVFDSLLEVQPAQYCYRTKEGIRYYFEDSSHRKLTRVEDPTGNQMNLSYVDGRLDIISEEGGREMNFFWDQGHLSQIKDLNGTEERLFQYHYQDSLLTEVINPLGYPHNYGYNQERGLVEIADPTGNATNIFYTSQYQVSQIVSCFTDQRFTYSRSTGTTYVSERLASGNQSTIYRFDSDDRLIEQKGNCCGFDQEYGYDQNNNINQLIDGNGNVFLYTFDNRGNSLTEQDPLGNASSFTYDPIFNQILSQTDKRGNQTTFEYNEYGKLTKVNYPLGYDEQFTHNNQGLIATYQDGTQNLFTYSYDVYGNPIQVDQPDGSQLFTEYDVWGNVIAEINANGDTVHFAYDKLNRAISRTDEEGFTTTFEYDSKDNRVAVIDAKGRKTRYEYDPFDRLMQMIAPYQTITTYAYDARNNLIAETDPNGSTIRYTYNQRNQKTSKTDRTGQISTYEYDANGNLIAQTNPLGSRTSFSYDALDRLTEITDAFGNQITYQYDPDGNLISEVDQNGNQRQYTYDAHGRRLSEIDALGHTATVSYDNNDNPILTRDFLGRETYYLYDPLDRLIATVNPLGDSIHYTFDSNGNQLTLTNELGLTTQFLYDKRNKLTHKIDPLGSTMRYSFDAVGNMDSVYYPSGNIATYQYDSLNRVILIRDLIGQMMEYGYDAVGNKIYTRNANGDSTQNVYDVENRVIQQTDGLGQSLQYAYDGNGNLVSQTNRNNQTTQYTYDALNRRIGETDALLQTTQYTYDGVGNRVEIIDAKGNSTSYTYDANNRQTSEFYANGVGRQVGFDAVGNIVSEQAGSTPPIFFEYDLLDRLTKKDYPGSQDEVFSYDALGRMLTANNAVATLSYTYDNANRVLSETLNGQTTSFLYDIGNNIRTISYPGGRVITEELDLRDRLESVKEGGTTLAGYTYDGVGRPTQRTYNNGTSTTWTYDANNQLTELRHQPGDFVHFSYEYDSEGKQRLITKHHRLDQSMELAYDANQRLTSFKVGTIVGQAIPTPSSSQTFNIDAVHNRSSHIQNGQLIAYQSNSLNQYSSITTGSNSPVTLSYDSKGNLTSDGTFQFQYDQENRLLSVDNGTIASYEYDARGRRINKNVGGVITRYFYSGARLIEEQDDSGNTLATYTYGIWVDDLLTMDRNAQRYYYHKDRVGSVVAMTDNSGNVVERYRYDAFGAPTFLDANFVALTGSTIQNSYLYTGRKWEEEIGYYYFRARHYDPVHGRFLQRDPLGYIDGLNLYHAYFSPNNRDPLGLNKESCSKTPAYKLSAPKKVVNFFKRIGKYLKKFKLFQKIGQVNVEVDANIQGTTCKKKACCDGRSKTLYKDDITITASASVEKVFGLAFKSKRPRVEVGGTIKIKGKLETTGGIIISTSCGADKGKRELCLSIRGSLSATADLDFTIQWAFFDIEFDATLAGKAELYAQYCLDFRSGSGELRCLKFTPNLDLNINAGIIEVDINIAKLLGLEDSYTLAGRCSN